MRTLVLYSNYLGTKKASYYDDWLDAFQSCPHFKVNAQNIVPRYLKVPNYSRFKKPQGCTIERRKSLYQILYQSYGIFYEPFYKLMTEKDMLWNVSDIHKYELIILLHSTNADSMFPLSVLERYLKNRKGKLLIFIGNEYCLMPEKIRFIKEVEADYIASQLTEEAANWLYSECSNSKVLCIPHALNDKDYQPIKEQRKRCIDIGFIGDMYGFAVGDNERTMFIEAFKNGKYGKDLNKDIRLGRKLRLPRSQYIGFLNSIRGTVGAESGTYYLEKTDQTQKQVDIYLSKFPKATFQDIYDRFFKKYSNPKNGKAISSRHFEPIGTKTAQILLAGRYNDILKPDLHYIEVKKDFSNIDNALEKFRDKDFIEKMTQDTHEYVMENHTYSHRIIDVWRAVS